MARQNDVERYSIHKEGKSVVTEGFIRTLRIKIDKYMTAILNKVYIGKLDDTINTYNNTYHKTIKVTLFDVKPST